MYQQASYHDVVDEVLDELRESMAFATGAGIAAERIIVDPGLGFAKEPAHSYEVLARLDEFAELGRPLLVGPSRKSFLARPLGAQVPPPDATGRRRRRSPRRCSAARTSCASTRCARWCRSSAWPTRFGSIIAPDVLTRDELAHRAAAPPDDRVVGPARHRARVVPGLRAAAAHPRHARRADGAQRRLPDRAVLPVAVAAARDRQLGDPQPRRPTSCSPSSCCSSRTSAARWRTSAARRSSATSSARRAPTRRSRSWWSRRPRLAARRIGAHHRRSSGRSACATTSRAAFRSTRW